MAYRTDLAVELLENLRGRDEFSGVSEREYEREGLHIHEAEVTTEQAARLLGKPCGRYLTLSLEALSRREEEAFPRSVRVLAALIETLLPPLDSAAPVLIAGLGSRSITPVADGGSLAHEIAQQLDGAQCEALDDLSQPFIITTRDIDREVADTARLIGYAVNMALQHISVEEIDLYLS